MSKKITTEEFIKRSRKVHGDKYDYSLVEYNKVHDKIKIICPIHGLFEQKAYSHYGGIGCSKCGTISGKNKQKLTTEEFIKKSITKHGGIYEYDHVLYINNSTKVNIICKVHGIFEQSPDIHIRGHGCPKFAILKGVKRQTKTTEQFIKEAKLIHGDKYDYSQVNYTKSKNKVKIICKEHGIFEQSPSGHLSGKGCRLCSNEHISKIRSITPSGWNCNHWDRISKITPNFDSFKVYIIRCWNDTEEFYKIGRTYRKIKDRFKTKKEMPYNYEVLEEIVFDTAKEAFNKEVNLKRTNKSFNYVPNIIFDGNKECFSQVK